MKKTTIFFTTVLLALALGWGGAAQAQYVYLGNGYLSENQAGVPAGIMESHSISQTIYHASEIGDACFIHAIAYFQKTTSSQPQKRRWSVYMSHTDKDFFESGRDWDVTVDNNHLVYSGPFWVSDQYEWTSIDLDTPFAYNGSDNLLITIIDDGDVDDKEHYFECSELPYKASLVKYSSDDFFSLSDLRGGVYASRWATKRANIRFFTSLTDTLPYTHVGNSDNISIVLPTYISYKNSCSEQIFSSEELGGEGSTVYGVRFNCMSSGAIVRRNVYVYLTAMEEDSVFADSTDWADVRGTDRVYRGGFCVGAGAGWYTVWFYSPVTLGPARHYILTVEDNNDHYGSFRSFAAHNVDYLSTIADWSDYVTFDACSLHGSAVAGEVAPVRNDVRFITLPQQSLGIASPGEPDGDAVAATVYPNPTTGWLTVSAGGLRRVEVMDATGRVVSVSENANVNLTGCTAGVYFVRVLTDGGCALRRVVLR